MRIVLRLLILTVLASSAASTAAQSNTPLPEEDTQFWSDVQLTFQLANKETPRTRKIFEGVDLQVTGTLRLGRNVTHPVDERASIGVEFKTLPYFKSVPNLKFKITPSYLYQAAQPAEGRKSYESRFIFAGTAEYKLGSFRLSDRNQVERRFRNSQPDSTRYRNRFGVEYETKFRARKLISYARDEVFYDWSVNDWVRNRLSLGTSLTFHKDNERYSAEIYYLRQNDGRSRPGDLHVIGTLFKVRVD